MPIHAYISQNRRFVLTARPKTDMAGDSYDLFVQSNGSILPAGQLPHLYRKPPGRDAQARGKGIALQGSFTGLAGRGEPNSSLYNQPARHSA